MTDKIKLFIKPNDLLFFRDGRPFDAGMDFMARLAFPPTPIPFYGAIRAAILGQRGDYFAQFDPRLSTADGWSTELETIGPQDEKRTLRISDFGLARRTFGRIKRFFPMPHDLVVEKSHGAPQQRHFVLQPRPLAKNTLANSPGGLQLLTADRPADSWLPLERPEKLLTQDGLTAYLQGQTMDNSDYYVMPETLYKGEPRIGIHRNRKTRSAQEGLLYAIEFARLDDGSANQETGFVLEINTDLLENGQDALKTLRLGGECRSVFYQTNDVEWDEIACPAVTNRFKLLLLTPAIFTNGWLPDGIDDQKMEGEIGSMKVRLISAALGRSVGIGGWDIVARQPKPVRRAVPAGSVYFFETGDGGPVDREALEDRLHLQSIHGDSNFAKQGLGITTIGAW